MHLQASYFTLLTLSLLLSSSNLPQVSGAALRIRQDAPDAPSPSSLSASSRSHSHSAHPSSTHIHSHSNHTSTYSHTPHQASATPHISHIAAVASQDDSVNGEAGKDNSEERPHRSLRWNRSASATWTGDWKTRTASRTGGWAGPTGRPSKGGSETAGSSSNAGSDVVGDDQSVDGLAKRSPRAPRRGSLPAKRSPEQDQQRSFSLSRREPNFAETVGFNSRIARLMLQQRRASADAKAIDIPKEKARLTRRTPGKNHYVVSGAAAKRGRRMRRFSSSMLPRRAGNIADAQDLHADQVLSDAGAEEVAGTPGTVAIMSHMNNSTTGKKLASLYMDPSNSAPYVLNASEKNATLLRLVPVSPSSSASSLEMQDPEQPVTLQTTIDNASYCATYDPNPPAPEPLTMQACFQSEGGKGDGASARKSQTFSFNKETGVIRPMWFVEGSSPVQEDDGAVREEKEDDGDDDGGFESGDGDDDGDDDYEGIEAVSSDSVPSLSAASLAVSSTASSSSAAEATPTAQGLTARDAPSSSSPEGAQNVTLVFVPSTETSDIDESDADERQSATATKTVTITASSSPPSSPSSSGLNAAVPEPSSSTTPGSSSSPSPSGTLKVEVFSSQSPSETSAGASVSSSMDQASATVMASETASVTTVTIPASSYEAAAASSSADDAASSSMSSMTAAQATATPAPSVTSEELASRSVDAELVASSIASSFSSSATPTAIASSTETGGPSSTMVAVVARRAGPAGKVRRARMAAVDTVTEPYKWLFRPEEDR